MGGFLKFLKFLRFKLKRRRMVDRVAVVDDDDDELDNINNSNMGSQSKDCCIINNGESTARFSWDRIQRFTNFSLIIGYGGFSTVYLAQFPEYLASAAVKIQCSSERLNQAYREELHILLRLHHPYIVKFLGYCDEREEGILVFEYVPNGTLHERLQGLVCGKPSNKSCSQTLSWKRRMTIAFQLAQAIEYLHDSCFVHADIKSSNILLDDRLNVKLCDFGSTTVRGNQRKMMMMMMGSPGYTDPHYLRTGLPSKNIDIYSFGVVVLELITGIQAFNPLTAERLTTRAEPMLRDTEWVVEMVDPILRASFDLEEAKAMVSLCGMCLCESPSLRPCASQILTTMRNNINSLSC